jgi:glucuronoarabinoxylan endo-1,4-beta-xylanase
MNQSTTALGRIIRMALLMLPVLAPGISAADLVVELSGRDQTVEGFGAFGAGIKSYSPFVSPALAARLVRELGLTISRGPLPFDFQRSDGSFNTSGDISRWLAVWKAMKAAGTAKFIISVWSPPPWMKNPGNHGHAEPWCADGRAGGLLLPEYYGRFAGLCVDFLKFFKSQVGVDVYALSIQNEPAFDEPYESCVYTPEQYREVLKTVAARMEAAGLSTRLFGPEDIGSLDRVMSYMNAITSDADALRGVRFLAVHGYAPNGIAPDSADARIWQTMSAAALKNGKQLWMTETSGYGQSWDDAMSLAVSMYTALRFGHVSGWCWWQADSADDAAPGAQALIGGDNGEILSSKCAVVCNFAHFVRPGAVRVMASCADSSILPLGFINKQTLTLVLLNRSDGQASIDVKGFTPSSPWRLFRSSATQYCADLGNLPAAGAIVLPARSLSTLQCAFNNQ